MTSLFAFIGNIGPTELIIILVIGVLLFGRKLPEVGRYLGKGIVVEAVSSLDGLVEAIRWTGEAYARGVQWHPEFHHGRHALVDSSPIMLDFLEASRAEAMRRFDAGLELDPRPPRAGQRLAA